MAFQVANNLRFRRSFGRIKKIIDLPYLIEIQKNSYDLFLQKDLGPTQRQNIGLQEVFKSVFPIKDFNETASLEFVSYVLGEPKYDVEECHQRGMTYAAPLKVTVQLVLWDVDSQTGSRSIKNVKEQEVYFGEMPLMTKNGTFMVNGTERVIVSQLHRSPGVFFEHDKGKTHASGKLLYSARVIPYRGSWVDLEFDPRDILYVRIDRRRKFHATVLLRALGMTTEDLLNYYYRSDTIVFDGRKPALLFNPQHLLGAKVGSDIRDPKTNDLIVKEGKKFTRPVLRQMESARIKQVPIDWQEIVGRIVSHDLVDPQTKEVIVECNHEITQEKLDVIRERGLHQIEVLFIEESNVGPYLRNTLLQDRIRSPQDAILEIYRRLRPGDPPTVESATNFFNNLFFNPDRYDLSKVGRLKLNHRLRLNVPLEQGTLRKEDILEVVRYLMELKNGNGSVDDIDHLGNRRVRAVGELVENHFRVGLVRMERAIKEKMSLQDIETLMPQELINYKPVSAALKEFFGSSQLSQFMDQTNPLSEITHKRRLSALGPGGLTRERAGFEVRDVHPTHYGRVCPIETPEGPNVGLISSLSTYARVNEFGFIETPYKRVEKGRVIDHFQITLVGDTSFKLGQIAEKKELEEENERVRRNHKRAAEALPYAFYLSAWEEENFVIAQANAETDGSGRIKDERVIARFNGEFITAEREKVDYKDISPKQLVSVATALIPFLEHDDANRALMGSNMQRQAVPLLKVEAPLVGTGLEATVARDSGAVVLAKRGGVVDQVDSERIIVRVEGTEAGGKEFGADIYPLTKFRRSNQNTCINQKPIVGEGQKVERGQVLADGPCTELGELALGRNILVAFMPWRGYNYEDAILVSERLVKDDFFTSIHIQEFDIEARDTKLGPEEITRDIPNVSENALRDLDESGIIRIGANVKPGDILVGKVTPKGETQLTPEEKLLRAIFGEKAGDVRDASLKCPPGIEGTVVDVKIFSRKGTEKDLRALSIEQDQIAKIEKNSKDEIRIIREEANKKIRDLLSGKVSTDEMNDRDGNEIVKKGGKFTDEGVARLSPQQLKRLKLKDEEIAEQIQMILRRQDSQIEVLNRVNAERIELLQKGDELPPGVIKMVKVYVAMKRKLSVGDKMAGRHGNKGVISRILADGDMPYLPDGTPIDIVLNPLGVPSRMNVGQILETHLGWAGKALGMHVATPVFDGATEGEIKKLLKDGNLPSAGKTVLYDGMTGEPFEQQVTVGFIYMMKLSHLVDDKIHARSIGPYSLITQQPLGGKAQFGGQRFGEMEVWALEAYGASYTLQELLTVKSDDVEGRSAVYEAIVKGEIPAGPGLPESFNVLVRELQSLCLDVELMKR